MIARSISRSLRGSENVGVDVDPGIAEALRVFGLETRGPAKAMMCGDETRLPLHIPLQNRLPQGPVQLPSWAARKRLAGVSSPSD